MKKFLAALLLFASPVAAQNFNLSVKQLDNPYVAVNNSGSIIPAMTCTGLGVPAVFYVIASSGPISMNSQDVAVITAGWQATDSSGANQGMGWYITRGTSAGDAVGNGQTTQLAVGRDFDNLSGNVSANFAVTDTGATGTVYYNLLGYCESSTEPVTMVANYSQINVTVLRR